MSLENGLELFYDETTPKERLAIYKPNHFYYKVSNTSSKRGCNRVVNVYGLTKTDLDLRSIGELHYHSATSAGNRYNVCKILHAAFNFNYLKVTQEDGSKRLDYTRFSNSKIRLHAII